MTDTEMLPTPDFAGFAETQRLTSNWLQCAGWLQVVAEHGVLDDTLDSVARQARDNSARH